MAARIERIIGHIVEQRIGFTYAMGKLEASRAVIWEIGAGRNTGIGESGWSSRLTGTATHYARSGDGMASTVTSRSSDGQLISRADRRMLDSLLRPLLGQDPLRRDALLPELPREFDAAFRMSREGVSIALNDLAGRILGAPVHALLGGKRRDSAPGMPVIHVGPPDVMARRARRWTTAGYRFLKIKLRGELTEDVAAMKAIRLAVGSRPRIQVDANEGYRRVAQAEKAIRALRRFNVELFEDMLNAPLHQIAALRRRTGARILIDREAFWPNIFEVCRAGAADVVNHHPNIQGGLDAALRIDAVATAAGMTTAIGSSGDFGIQDAAFQMLACVIGLSRPCEDIGLLPYYSGPTRDEYEFDREPSVIKKPFPIVRGTIRVPDEPGLGVEIDRKKLKAATVATFIVE